MGPDGRWETLGLGSLRSECGVQYDTADDHGADAVPGTGTR